MSSIKNSFSTLLAIPASRHFDLAVKGLQLGSKLLKIPVAATLSNLYLQYAVAQSAFTVVSGYAGQYEKLQGGYTKTGFTPPKEFGSLFSHVEGSKNSWDVLSYRFDRESIVDVQSILHKIYHHIDDPEVLQIMTAQILTKVLVNKNAEFLQVGQEIEIPGIDSNGDKQLVTYVIDEKFDLWNGVPAYGFIDREKQHPPLLVFRATNTLLEEKDTLPTLVANLHPKGPAWKLFSNSEKKIQEWLETQTASHAQKARVMGFSQGGVLGAYFLTYHSPYFGLEPHQASYLFDAPGVSRSVEQDWEKIEKKPCVNVFVNRGDLIPKVGDSFIGRAFEVRIAQNLKGFKSHQALSLFAPQWMIVEIALSEEKKSVSRSILSALQKVAGLVVYNPAKAILLPSPPPTSG